MWVLALGLLPAAWGLAWLSNRAPALTCRAQGTWSCQGLANWLGTPTPEHPEAGEAMNPLQLTCGLTDHPRNQANLWPSLVHNLHMDFPGV